MPDPSGKEKAPCGAFCTRAGGSIVPATAMLLVVALVLARVVMVIVVVIMTATVATARVVRPDRRTGRTADGAANDRALAATNLGPNRGTRTTAHCTADDGAAIGRRRGQRKQHRHNRQTYLVHDFPFCLLVKNRFIAMAHNGINVPRPTTALYPRLIQCLWP